MAEFEIGDRYGEWTVIGKSHNKSKYYVRCECSCGKVKDVDKSSLKLGRSTNCGHLRGKGILKNSDEKMIGKRFGRLTVIKRVSDKGKAVYRCQCDCGNVADVKADYLMQGRVNSCGCIRSESSKKSMAKIQKQGLKKTQENSVENTNLLNLQQKKSKNNTSGYKGVSQIKSGKSAGKYRAYIYLKRQQKYLGTFDTAEEAYQARLEAEEKYFKPILDKYKDK